MPSETNVVRNLSLHPFFPPWISSHFITLGGGIMTFARHDDCAAALSAAAGAVGEVAGALAGDFDDAGVTGDLVE